MDLCALWGGQALRLRERLACAATVRERFALLEAALLAELGAAARGHRAIPPALHLLQSSSLPMAVLAERSNLSQRRLIQLFGHEVGATPKLFQRLQRFQRSLCLARGQAESAEPANALAAGSSWAQMAQDAGYCDQSHWIRDCTSFSGLTPAQYASQWTGQVKADHLPLHSELVVAERR